MQIDHTAFFNGYRDAYGKLTPGVIAGLELIGRNMESDPQLKNLQWAAYMLATVKHECDNRWQPILEKGPRSYFESVRDRNREGSAPREHRARRRLSLPRTRLRADHRPGELHQDDAGARTGR